jgi:hypothetical protein
MPDRSGPNREEIVKAQADFLNKVWTDDTYRARLESNPEAVLKEMGGQVPDDVEIKVVSDTDTIKYLHIPLSPPQGEISDADLEAALGGTNITMTVVMTVTGSIGLTVLVSITESS